MNALFYFAGYNFSRNEWSRFLLTVPDGPHDRYEVAEELLIRGYPKLNRWSGQFACLTTDTVFKEL